MQNVGARDVRGTNYAVQVVLVEQVRARRPLWSTYMQHIHPASGTAIRYDDRALPPRHTSDELLAAGVCAPVFSCYWPETRAVVERLWQVLPHGLGERLYGAPYRGGQEGASQLFVESWLAWRRTVVAIDERDFVHRYATAGATDAIGECIAAFAIDRWSHSRPPVLHLLDGDGESHRPVAEGYGVRVDRHDRSAWRESFTASAGRVGPGDLVMISQPSSIDGNLWPDFTAFLAHLESELPDARVALDLAYVGTVGKEYQIDATSPLIDTVFFSLGKPFGVSSHRLGGVISRRPLPGIDAARWLRNTFSLELGRQLLDALPPRTIAEANRARQELAVATVRETLGTPMVKSDVVLMAHHPWRDDLPAIVAPLRRGNTTRYCLTPALDRLIAEVGITPARLAGYNIV